MPDIVFIELKKRLGWRNKILNPFFKSYKHKQSNELKDIYQFGVFTGFSICELVYIFSKNNVSYRKIFGFDSFCGLPEEKEEKVKDDWKKGSFSSVSHFSTDKNHKISIKQTMEEIKKIIKKYSNETAELKQGFFEDKFKEIEKSPSMLKEFTPALYVDIDVDIYSSAKEVLEFMLKNKLIRKGTLIGYDDWGATVGYENYSSGESRAHKESMEKYNVDCELVGSNGMFDKNASRVYLVKSIK